MEVTSKGFKKPAENEYYGIEDANHNAQLTNDLFEGVDSAIGQIAVQKDEVKTTNFNPDGSITEVTLAGGVTVRTKTTTFPSSTQIVETIVENGVTTVKTTTFNPDGTISEGVI